MFCKKCGTKIEEGGKFCPNCGEPVQTSVRGQGYSQNGGQMNIPEDRPGGQVNTPEGRPGGRVNAPGNRPGGQAYRGPQGDRPYNGPSGGPYGNVPPVYGGGRSGGNAGGSPGGRQQGGPSGKGPGKNTGLVIVLSILIVLLIVSIAAGIFLIVKNQNESAPAEKQISGQLESDGKQSERETESRGQTEPVKQQETKKQAQTEKPAQAQTQAVKPPQSETQQTDQQKQPETQKQTEAQKQTETAAQTETEKTVRSYTLVKGDYTWSEALKYCQEHGGYLASVTSEEEQKMAEAEIAKDPTVKVVWLGAENLSTGGTFKWSNGDEFTYSKWAPGEPNNDQGLEHYLVMYYVDDEWVWNDAPDDVSQYYAGKIGFLMETEQPGN